MRPREAEEVDWNGCGIDLIRVREVDDDSSSRCETDSIRARGADEVGWDGCGINLIRVREVDDDNSDGGETDSIRVRGADEVGSAGCEVEGRLISDAEDNVSFTLTTCSVCDAKSPLPEIDGWSEMSLWLSMSADKSSFQNKLKIKSNKIG